MNRAVEIERDDCVAVVRLAKPPLNVIDIPMMVELREVLGALAKSTRIVQFEAAPGCRAFSAGVDVADHTAARAPLMLEAFHSIFKQLCHESYLTVSVVRGACLGGGAELACFCDHVIAAEPAMFGFPEIRVGSFPPVASVILPSLIGTRRAAEMILTGEQIDARTAVTIGLINSAVPEEQLEAAARDIRGKWLTLSPSVLAVAKRLVRWSDFPQRLREAEEVYRRELLPLGDAAEGVRAFLEHRSPAWQKSRRLTAGEKL